MSRAPGRPKNAELDEALIRTAREMIIEDGLAALTVDGLVKRVGTTRPTFYRRYRDLSDLVIALMREPLGPQPDMDTGVLRDDLHVYLTLIAAYLSNPLIFRSMPALILKMSADPCVAEISQSDFFGPQVTALQAVLDRAVARGEIAAGRDATVVFEMLVGPVLARTLLHLGRPDETLVSQVATMTAWSLARPEH